MCGSSPPDPPDYGPIAEANKALGEDALKLSRDQFRWARRESRRTRDVISEVVSGALKTEEQNRDFAARERRRYENKYVPLENARIKEAQEYDTEARRDAEAGRATAEIGHAFTAERNAAERRLASFGIDPSMLRAGSLANTSRIAEAEAKAGAATGARRRVEDLGRALRADVVNTGRGLPSSVAQAYGTSLAGGQTAAGSQTSGVHAQTAALTSPAVYGNQAINAYGGATNALNTGYGNALAAYEAEQTYGLPGIMRSIGGLALGAGAGRIGFSEGGTVSPAHSPSGGAIPDDVPASVDVGEYIVPEDVVRWQGEKFFVKLTDKAREERTQGIPTEGSRA